jgi:5'-3' exoribonuclease 2
MGVPAFFRWLSLRYPKILEDVEETKLEEEEMEREVDDLNELDLDNIINPQRVVNNLYLDMNGIIHPCSHPTDGTV